MPVINGRSTNLLGLLVVAGVLGTGCGHTNPPVSSPEGARSPHRPSNSSTSTDDPAFRRQSPGAAELLMGANIICQRLNQELEAMRPTSLSVAELRRFTPSHAAMERRALRQLEALRPPASLFSEWQKLLGYRRQLLAQLKRLARAAASSDNAQIARLTTEKAKLHGELASVGARLGSPACGKLG